jgi:DNA uptake protein ComE-like DNA-binding protein
MPSPWWKSYFHFTRRERNGVISLLLLIAVLLSIRICLPGWVKRPEDPKEDQNLMAAWEQYKNDHKVQHPGKSPVTPTTASLFRFDPNTIDSADCLRLGLRPVTTRMLLNWRRSGKVFHNREDLKPLYTLKPEEYQRLEPYIEINPMYARQTYPAYSRIAPLPSSFDLNTADSSMLVRLNGIGPVLAHKIVEKRKALGGYLRHEQLKDIYPFPDTTFSMLRERLTIRPELVRKLKLNSCGLEELRAHPDIGEKMAKNILIYREGLQRFDNIEQLRQVPLMNEEIYRKIAPYFTLD